MSHVFPRQIHVPPPFVAGGEGCYLVDRDGRRYLDASGGAAVSCLGHGDRAVIDAIKAQLDRVAFAHTGFFTSEPAEALADLLVENAPPGLERVYFVSGGSEAVEAALKLARQYAVETGQPQRRRLIARRQSYHGNTLGALAAGGNAWRRAPFDPLLVETHHVAPCNAYRERREGESDVAYGARLVAEFEAEIARLDPETVLAFIAEPVVGATLGAVPAVPGYFTGIREVCDRHGILLILDEVMCGMGRTGTLWACAQEDIVPDIACIAKGLGAGYQPIGAMLCSGAIFDALAAGSGAFQHGHTYVGHPAACAAGLAVVERLTGGLADRASEMGSVLEAELEEAFADHPHVGDLRGRGLFRGLELVLDRESRAPFPPEARLHAQVKRAAFEAGLICYPMGGTIDGRRGDHVLLAPPFIIDADEIGELVDKLSRALDIAVGATRNAA